MATDQPNWSFAMPSDAVNSFCSDQLVPARTNTYAAPVARFLFWAPTIAESPRRATDQPNWSPAAPSGAVSTCCTVQFVPERTNTYAAPMDALPAALFSPYAPTRAVSPLTATDQPKLLAVLFLSLS